MASLNRPVVTSLNDVVISFFSEGDRYLYHSFSYLGPDDEAWYGTISKKDSMDCPTLEEINQQLHRVAEANIYPRMPVSASMTIAAAGLQNVHIKRPEFMSHNEKVPDFWARVLLHEASIMEQISSHPNIIAYHGCCVHRGRITGIVLEHLEKTLAESAPLVSNNIPAFMAELQSAVDHLHGLGLAHNDITPHNIMIKDGHHPVLIDFGACAPPGHLVHFCGTPGWCKKPFFRSEVEHDVYAMDKLRTWLESGGGGDGGKGDSQA